MAANQDYAISLRKACCECARSKRRCIVQLPKCTRCTKKRLSCTYALEPLQEQKESPIPDPMTELSPYCYLSLVAAMTPHKDLRSVININAEWSTTSYIVWVHKNAPELLAKGKPAPFIHPKMQFRAGKNHLDMAQDLMKMPYNEQIRELLDTNMEEVPLQEALTAVQALMLYLIVFLFDSDASAQRCAESYIGLLDQWIETLATTAGDRMPQDLSPWQSWLLGEATRRTIFMGYTLPCTYSGWKYGTCRHRLCFESLPFDGRIGLWQAESPQAWISAAGVKSGAEVGTQLVSFHEFGSSGRVIDPDDDTFLSLSLVAHNGERARVHKSCPGMKRGT